MTMTATQLSARIRKLRSEDLIAAEFEHVIARRGTWRRDGVWYTTQKEHWIGWLSEYGGPGYYGRKNSHRSAEFIYNHVVCPPMVLWLAEASGIRKARLSKAKGAALSASAKLQAQSAAIRKNIPWKMIEARLDIASVRSR
jgi:hypothetical protein